MTDAATQLEILDFRLEVSGAGEARSSVDRLKDSFIGLASEAGSGTKSVRSGIASIGSSLGDIATSVRTGLVASAGTLVDFGLSALDMAADLERAMGRANATFAGSADEILAWSETTSTELGLSQGAALTAANEFGTLFNSLGFGAGDTAALSENMVRLAADLSSFSGIGIDETLERLRAGLHGDTEALGAFIGSVSEANVQAQAFQSGIATAGEDLTASQEALATYALILDEASGALGHFGENSDSFANQQKIVQAQIEELTTSFGALLLPIAETVLPHVIGALDGLSAWFDDNREQIVETLDTVMEAFGTMAGVFMSGLEALRGPFESFLGVMEVVFGFILDNKPVLIGALVAIGAAVATAFGPASLAIVAIAGFVGVLGAFRDNWKQIAVAILKLVDGLVDGILDGLDALVDKFGDALESLIGLIPGRFLGLAGIDKSELQVLEGGLGLGDFDELDQTISDLESSIAQEETDQGVQDAIDRARELSDQAAAGAESYSDVLTNSVIPATDAARSAESSLADARQQAIDRIAGEQTAELVEAFLRGGEAQVAVVREQQQELNEAWTGVAADLGEVLGVQVPEEFRGMWESILEEQEAGVDAAIEAEQRLSEERQRAAVNNMKKMQQQLLRFVEQGGVVTPEDVDFVNDPSNFDYGRSTEAEAAIAALAGAGFSVGQSVSDAVVLKMFEQLIGNSPTVQSAAVEQTPPTEVHVALEIDGQQFTDTVVRTIDHAAATGRISG